MAPEDRHAEFMDLFLANQVNVYAFVRSLIPNHSDAEEVFQQVGLTLWRKRDAFDPELGSFRARAIGVARNHIRNYARHQQRDRQLLVLAPDVLDRIAEGWGEIDNLWEERQEALTKCLEKLAAPDRQRLEHFYGGDVRPKAMAAADGIPLRTFYRRIQKLREFLRICITRTLDAEGGAHGHS